MKITVTIPSRLLKRAEVFSKQNKISLNRLISKAMEEYLDRRRVRRNVTEELNKFYSNFDQSEMESIQVYIRNPKEEW